MGLPGLLIAMSSPLVGGVLGQYLGRRLKKGALFQTGLFSASLVPALAAFSIIFFNGTADRAKALETRATVLRRTTLMGKMGRTYRITFHVWDREWASSGGARERSIGKGLFEKMREGQEIKVYIKPGSLSIPWIEKLAP